MSKCENCIHYDVCYDIIEYGELHDFKENGDCPHFKDKSLCVELPCRCKDCEYSRPLGVEGSEIYICSVDTHYSGEILVEDDDFCKYAERKLEVGE